MKSGTSPCCECQGITWHGEKRTGTRRLRPSRAGWREDLASVFIAEGAAVIASPVPLVELMGVILSESLYDSASWPPDRRVSEILLSARVRIARELRGHPIWPLWSTLAYHGNPFAALAPA